MRRVALVLLSACLMSSGAYGQNTRPLTVDDLFEIKDRARSADQS